jgi:hypothetical protein
MFYNDGYRPMLGGEQAPAVPRSQWSGSWAEIWDIIGPMMDQVIETGRATWLGDRRMNELRQMAVEARTANEAARLCAEILGHNLRDIPFALVYLADGVGKHLHLAGHTGLLLGASASPLTADMVEADAVGWPLAAFGASSRTRARGRRSGIWRIVSTVCPGSPGMNRRIKRCSCRSRSRCAAAGRGGRTRDQPAAGLRR